MRQSQTIWRIPWKITPRMFLGNLKTVLVHKYFVGKYCFMCGLYWQGIVHDLSKFTPIEFIESCKFYTGTQSPIDTCKKCYGYSNAWLHHRGRNYHHWEMWLDNFEKGTTRLKMPFKYALEMVCDFLGAGRAYNGKSFSIQGEYEWWLKKREVALLHEDTLMLIDVLFSTMEEKGIENTLKDSVFIDRLGYVYKYHSELLSSLSPFTYEQLS